MVLPNIIFQLAFPIVGILLFVMGFRIFAQKKLIQDIPMSKIRSLAMGLVEIYGDVIPLNNKILKSPFTKKDCVYYRYEIEEYRSGKNSRWVTINSGMDFIPFLLKDDTGSVLVDPKGAQVEIPSDFIVESGIGKEPPYNIKEFLEANKIPYMPLFSLKRKLRYTEYYIAPNDKLYIIGTAGDNPHVEETKGKGGNEDIMIQKGEHQKFYYISDKPELEVVKHLNTQSIILIIIGAIFTVIGIAIFVG